jgi:hypothetical protein
VGSTLGEAILQPAALTNHALIVQQFGSAFIIDPIGVAVMAVPGGLDARWNPIASAFPATGHDLLLGPFSYSADWKPWGSVWPVRRATFQHPTHRYQMERIAAEHYFRGNDDLTTDLPDRDDRPASQNWDIDKNGTPLARQWKGDYTWLVTVLPTSNRALEGIGGNPEGFAYDVSVVVFYKRVLPEDAVTVGELISTSPVPGGQLKAFRDTMGDQERAVRAGIVSTGLNGGELLLTDLADNPSKSPFDGLKVGQWIMLCGPHPNSNVNLSPTGEPRFALNWYQVLSIDTEGTGIQGFDQKLNRVVAVRGSQWPWQPNRNAGHLSNNLCVAICRGAVAVHTKTIRLEGPSGSAFGIGSPNAVEQQPPFKPTGFGSGAE